MNINRFRRPPYLLGLAIAISLSLQIGCNRSLSFDDDPSSNGVAASASSVAKTASRTLDEDPPPDASIDSLSSVRVDSIRRSRQQIDQEHWESANESLMKLLAIYPTDSEALFLMAIVFHARGETSQAIELLDEIPVSKNGLAIQTIGRSAELCVELKRYDDAVNRYLKLIKLIPTSALAHRRLASLYNDLGRRHEAARHVRLLCKIGDVRQDELHSLMVLSDTNTEIPFGPSGRARVLFTKQKFALAADAFGDDGVDTADPPAVRAFYGRCLAEMQDDERLLRWMEQLDTPTKSYAETWSAIGTWMVNHQRFEEAVGAFAEAILRDPTDARSYRRMHQSLVALGMNVEAEKWETQQAKLREVTIASNELGTTHQGDAARYHTVIDGLVGLGRPLESVLWNALAISQQPNAAAPQSRDMLNELNQKRLDLVQSGDAFPSANIRLCGLDINRFPKVDFANLVDPAMLAEASVSKSRQSIASVQPPRFDDIAVAVGLNHTFQVASVVQKSQFMIQQSVGGGVAVIDFDLDGECDLYFAQGGADPPEFIGRMTNQLFRNLGGQLVDVTQLSATTERRYSTGVTAGDWNQDGFADLAISNIGSNTLMINNGDGTFRSEAIDSSDDRTQLSTSIAMADLSGDGLPDIYEENYVGDPDIAAKPKVDGEGVLQIVAPSDYQPAIDRICESLGSGDRTSRPVSVLDSDRRTGLGIVITNLDLSPGNEVFVGNDVRANQLWRRDSAGDWFDAAPTAGNSLGFDGSLTASMGIAMGDFDRSGTPDLHVTNFEDSPARLYLNYGGSFQDRAMSMKLSDDSFKVLGFGSQSLDYNNDGCEDLVVANGHVENMDLPTSPFQQPPQVFANFGDHFELQRHDDPSSYFGSLHVGRAMARLDFNRDGKSDFVVTHMGEPSGLLINQTQTDHHWLQLSLVGVSSERDAIGATIEVNVGDQTWTGWVVTGDGYLCRNEQVVSFGLGEEQRIDDVTVTWPDGSQSQYSEITVDQRWLIVQNNPNAFSLSQ
ncbi:FG-GAP-like repeat-containing protein [Rubripirellula reticaptiva]|uniref:ASPIC and UnbV n=1 Tax=Rubripirellula reticaptiva TaxID=2528013 RepID=A0A5C6FE04_9BACT|nr:FG-GAP-like repeat-containing protein [Rubripirellula reticaptiva]TWU57859.1 ASPIC and UnbV [Rubripirellula reticaptiva]